MQHPDLTLGQISSALGYHAEHADEIDAEIGGSTHRIRERAYGD